MKKRSIKVKMVTLVVAIIIFASIEKISSPAWAENQSPQVSSEPMQIQEKPSAAAINDSNEPPPHPGVEKVQGFGKYLSNSEVMLSILVLAFAFMVIIIEYLLMRKNKFSSDDLLKVISVTMILTGTLFVITAGFDSNQIAPAMGLFGTIAGYLLGQQSNTGSGTEKNNDTDKKYDDTNK